MRASRRVPLPLILALALAPTPDSVELDRDTWAALRPASPAERAVPAWAASRAVKLTPVAGGVLLHARWTLRSLSPGAWFSGHVLGDMPGMRVEVLRWDGAPAAAAVGPDGVRVAGRVSGRAVVEVVAFVPGDPVQRPLALRVMPATRGRVEAGAPEGLVATLRLADATTTPRNDEGDAAPLKLGADFWTGAAALELAYGSPASAAGGAAVVVARAGVGVTVGDAELRGRARLVWEVRRGALESVEFQAEGVGADLEVTGPGVRAVERSGGSVRALLQAPVSGRLELDLRWTSPIGKAAESRAALPQIRFGGVFRAESTLQLARDGEVEAVPSTPGWTAIRAAALPGWGQGLVEGTPTAAFAASGPAEGSLELLRFVPIEGPPAVIDVAAYTIATSREGRALMRAHYEIRNERAALLRIRPPPGFVLLGVRVAGETAVIARDRAGAWRVPLQRSVDTVSGALSFPVEVALLGEAVPWDRRERRALPLPRLDAPVAATRVTLYLPPGYRSRLKAGEGEVVAAFTKGEGITYGLGVGAVGAAQADALFQSAVKRWLANDFAGAQDELDQLKGMGASNENVARLQGNLDLIAGRGGKQDAGVQRRIREQAKARAVSEQVAQEKLKKQAEESRKSGDYKAAQAQYQAALAVGDRLAQLEQKESVEQQARNDALRFELESTGEEEKRAVVGKKAMRAASATTPAPPMDAKNGIKTPPGGGEALFDREDGLDAPVAAAPVAAPEMPRSSATSDARSAPVGGTSRDFTAIVDVTPTGSRDAAGVRLAGSASAGSGSVVGGQNPAPPAAASREPLVLETMDPPRDSLAVVQSAPGVARGRFRLRGKRAAKAEATKPASPPPVGPQPAAPPTGLPAPQVTASAVSVVVPAVGEAVLYQRLLLPADAEYAVEVSAREPLLSRNR